MRESLPGCNKLYYDSSWVYRPAALKDGPYI